MITYHLSRGFRFWSGWWLIATWLYKAGFGQSGVATRLLCLTESCHNHSEYAKSLPLMFCVKFDFDCLLWSTKNVSGFGRAGRPPLKVKQKPFHDSLLTTLTMPSWWIAIRWIAVPPDDNTMNRAVYLCSTDISNRYSSRRHTLLGSNGYLKYSQSDVA